MISLENIISYPAGLPLMSDEMTEFHASRILLLVHICGVSNRIDGLTKMAKLDFFVRYPSAFHRALQSQDEINDLSFMESSMVRYHYGPWDRRYYHVLAYLKSRGLLVVEQRRGQTFTFKLTSFGISVAKTIRNQPSFEDLVTRMQLVKKQFGSKSSKALKDIIYTMFDYEVRRKPLGDVITI